MPEAAPPATGLSAGEAAEFDELLASDAGSPSASAPARAVPGAGHPLHGAEHAPHNHTAAPSWAEFSSGWDLGLYQDPVLCAVLAGVVLGVLGVFVVLRRAVFVTAAVSQSAAFGVAVAFLIELRLALTVSPVLSAFVFALGAATLLAGRFDRWRIPKETWLGFTYIAASAGAVMVGDRINQEAHDISAILFGTAVLVRPMDFGLVAGVGAAVVCVIAVFYRGLVFAGFDAESARVQGIPVRFLELLLWVLVAAEVSVTTRAIGALPVFAFAVLPAMTALALVERLRRALLLAGLLGGLAGGLGYLFAFFLEFPVGASQAFLAGGFFLLALPLSRLKRSRGGARSRAANAATGAA